MGANARHNRVIVDFQDVDVETLTGMVSATLGGTRFDPPRTRSVISISGMYGRLCDISIRRMVQRGHIVTLPHEEDEGVAFIITTQGKVAINSPVDFFGSIASGISIEKSRLRRVEIQGLHVHVGSSIPVQALKERLSVLIDGPVTRRLAFSSVADLNTPHLTRFSHLMSVITGEELETLTGSSAAAPGHARNMIIDSVLEAWPHNYTDTLNQPAALVRPRHVKEVVDYINAYPEALLSNTELADIAHTSVRALQEGFRKFIGCSIVEYQRQVRLERAHDDLLQHPDWSVSYVASRWGFSNVGRFCRYFQDLYGVSPATIRCQ